MRVFAPSFIIVLGSVIVLSAQPLPPGPFLEPPGELRPIERRSDIQSPGQSRGFRSDAPKPKEIPDIDNDPLNQPLAKPGPKTMPAIANPSTPMPMTSQSVVAQPTQGDYSVMFRFKPGDEHLLQMESSNGLFKFFVGGRLQVDATWLHSQANVQAPIAQGGIGPTLDAVNFRRARFDFGGTFYRNIDFLMEFDFINTVNAERTGAPLAVNTPVPTDMNVTFKEIPYIGNLKVGNQKQPLAFEHLTSSRFLNFMERSLAFDAFVENQNNGFTPGIQAFNTAFNERLTWALGVFKNTRSIFGWNTGYGEYDVSGRVTVLPIYENNGETLVHLGLGMGHRGMDDRVDRMRARLLVRDGPAVLHNVVADVSVLGDGRTTIIPEFVAVNGPWTFAAEYYAAYNFNATIPVTGGPRTNFGTAFFQGGYMECLYFLTGEHREYNRKTGAFTRVTPRANYRGLNQLNASNTGCGDECGLDPNQSSSGLGAWQVGVRYSWLDLDNKGIRGGSVQDITLGLNWFLNPYMKIQWNYTALYRNAFVEQHDGWVQGLGVRLAFDF